MRLLAVDPGKMTGWAQLWDGQFSSGQLSCFEFLEWQVSTFAAYDAVILERFRIGPQTLTKQADAHWAIGTNFIVTWWATTMGTRVILQDPAQAKSFATNDKLKAIGWRRPSGGGHADDAARHLLVAVVDLRLVSLESLVPGV